MEKIIKDMLEQKKWAVVGATQNTSKFGYKIVKKLVDHEYDVYPINPRYDQVDSLKCYPSLDELPVDVDCISVVVSPEQSEKVLEMALEKGIKRIWFQPGTFTPELIEKAEDAGIATVYFNCVLVELDKK